MLFEDQSTKCPSCKNPLTWKSHTKRWESVRLVDEFTFRCESCKREYEFKDDKVSEKKHARDPLAESEAIERTLLLAAINRRCGNCGGPIARSHGVAVRCDWCHQDYKIINGELEPNTEGPIASKLSMRDFYSLETTQQSTVTLKYRAALEPTVPAAGLQHVRLLT